MLKELSQLKQQTYLVTKNFKQYLTDKSIPIDERWYAFRLYGSLLPVINAALPEFDDIYTRYNLKKFFGLHASLLNKELVEFVTIIDYAKETFTAQELNQLKSDLLNLLYYGVRYEY